VLQAADIGIGVAWRRRKVFAFPGRPGWPTAAGTWVARLVMDLIGVRALMALVGDIDAVM
jgi:hypothetical protein